MTSRSPLGPRKPSDENSGPQGDNLRAVVSRVAAIRDPHRDPRPGDFLDKLGVLVRVDHVGLGGVYVAVFRVGASRPYAVTRVAYGEFLEAVAGASVVELPEDDPRHAAMILEAGA